MSLSQGIKSQLDGLASTSSALLKSHQTSDSESQQHRSAFFDGLQKLDTARRDSHDEQMGLLRSMADNISSIASQMSGGSYQLPDNNSGRNSPAGDNMGSGRGSPHTGYSPGMPRVYTPPQSYGTIPYSIYPYNSAEDNTNPFASSSFDYMPQPIPRLDRREVPPPLPPPAAPLTQPRPASSVPADKLPPQLPPPLLPPLLPATQWSCANVLGIDQLATEKACCLFCELAKKDQYTGALFVDTVSFGRHLVEEHYFGSCDLDNTFTSARAFATHVLIFHCGTHRNGASHWADAWVIEKLNIFISHGRTASPDTSARSLNQGQVITEQKPSTRAWVQTHIRSILQIQGLWPVNKDPDKVPLAKDKTTDDEKESADLEGIMTALQRLETSTDAQSTETLFKIACLLEEATVFEFSEKATMRNYETVEHNDMALAASQEFIGKVSPFEEGYFIVRPVEPSTDCRSCKLSANMAVHYKSTVDITRHLRVEHGILDDDRIGAILREHVKTVPLRVSWIWFPRILPDEPYLSQIDRWMLHCFLSSPNWRILCRAFTQSPTQSMGDWAADVLRHWQHGPLPSHFGHPLIELTDGAVNSRDHTASSPSVRGSVARPADVGARTGAFACTHYGCSMRFETLFSKLKHENEAHAFVPYPRGNAAANPKPTGAAPYECRDIHPRTRKPCTAVFKTQAQFRVHQAIWHRAAKKRWNCDQCAEKKVFSRPDALVRHYRVCHPGVVVEP